MEKALEMRDDVVRVDAARQSDPVELVVEDGVNDIDLRVAIESTGYDVVD